LFATEHTEVFSYAIASGSSAVAVHGRTVNVPDDGISWITRTERNCRAAKLNPW